VVVQLTRVTKLLDLIADFDKPQLTVPTGRRKQLSGYDD
jgi:hypothetical protein